LSNTTQPTDSPFKNIFNEWKILLKLGAPILVAQVAQVANGVVDTVMSGHASAHDLAGVGIGASIWIPLLLFFTGVLSALQPSISQLNGAKDWQAILPTAWQGIYIAIVCALLMVCAIFSSFTLLDLFSVDPTTLRVARGYLIAFTWGVPALLLMIAFRGLTDGLSHTRVFMFFSVMSTLLNIPLNAIFIFGVNIFNVINIEPMGGVGCGYATSLSNTLACIAFIIYLETAKSFSTFRIFNHVCAPNLSQLKSLLHLGLPIGISMFVEVSMFCVIALFLARLGANVVAGHQIVLSATSLIFMLPLSLGFALSLRVSYLVGANQKKLSQTLVRSSLLLALFVALINAPLIYFFRTSISQLYTNDIAVQKIAEALFVFAALFQIADVVQVTMINALRGYKDTKIPMLITLLSFWLICLPLGYLLSFTDWITTAKGASGFWLALIIGLSCAAILLTLRAWILTREDSTN
jgi:MATE family multidrug resistance protein